MHVNRKIRSFYKRAIDLISLSETTPSLDDLFKAGLNQYENSLKKFNQTLILVILTAGYLCLYHFYEAFELNLLVLKIPKGDSNKHITFLLLSFFNLKLVVEASGIQINSQLLEIVYAKKFPTLKLETLEDYLIRFSFLSLLVDFFDVSPKRSRNFFLFEAPMLLILLLPTLILVISFSHLSYSAFYQIGSFNLIAYMALLIGGYFTLISIVAIRIFTIIVVTANKKVHLKLRKRTRERKQ